MEGILLSIVCPSRWCLATYMMTPLTHNLRSESQDRSSFNMRAARVHESSWVSS
jgi:hypothetical protein